LWEHRLLEVSDFFPILDVSLLVIIQVALSQERGGTSTLYTDIRPETCVGPDVGLEIALFVETFATRRKWTDKGFDSLMGSLVNH